MMFAYYLDVATDQPIAWENQNLHPPREKRIRDDSELQKFWKSLQDTFGISLPNIEYREHEIIGIVRNTRPEKPEISIFPSRKDLKERLPDFYEACKMVAAFDHSDDNWLEFDQMTYRPKEVGESVKK